MAELRSSEGGDILVAGSVSLVRALLAADLIDELRLMLFPIVLGDGKRLFGDADEARTLKLAGTQAFDSGTVILTYQRP